MNEIEHSGILGMRWGLRRFQNYDGSLTPEGRERYGVKGDRSDKIVDSSTKSLVDKREYMSRRNKSGENSDHSDNRAERPPRKNLYKANPKRMSPIELSKNIARLNEEKRYRDLVKQYKRDTHPVLYLAADILEGGARSLGRASFDVISFGVKTLGQLPFEVARNTVMKNSDGGKNKKKNDGKKGGGKAKYETEREVVRGPGGYYYSHSRRRPAK